MGRDGGLGGSEAPGSTTWTVALVPELGSQALPRQQHIQGQEVLTIHLVQERSRVPPALVQTGSLLQPNPGPSGELVLEGRAGGCAGEPSTQWGSRKK